MNKLFPPLQAMDAARANTAGGAIPIARANGGEDAFGVYLHWPFCLAKCPYCDFNSHVRHKPVDQARFSEAFLREMECLRERTGPRTITSIFLGGGTPSLMQPETVGALLDGIASHWSVAPDIEVTLEANPTSVEADRFRGYRAAGVNRVSLGIQALNDPDLRRLGRMHSVEEAKAAIRLAREIFPRLSFDLIYARPPNQTIEAWREELKEAIGLAADHLSLYQLTIEEGTQFYNLWKAGKLTTPDPDHAAALYEETQRVTAEHGLPAYEISNHAVPGRESQHNLVYWRYGQYVGIGPGAHGRFVENDVRTVTMTEKHPETWLDKVERNGHGIIEEEYLDGEQEGDEFLMMGLRLREGIDLARYERLSGHAVDEKRLAKLIAEGMIEPMDGSFIRATPDGALVLDALVADLAA
ncbi:coproporphyrinogen III oxidase [Brucella intermedia 229E]|uniref:Heme chaperone HemW n=1 Tax=Brucella intermedia 229E TaxID=1337887 RepID=U4VLK4_9HYPH|nr:coproporphyrinogen III oxidase [Brucella intermedia 229E]